MKKTDIVDCALATLGGDRELLAELSGLFLSESSAMLDSIRDAVSADNGLRLERSAHLLRGVLASLGASEAAEAAHTLEMFGRRCTLADWPAALAELEAQVAVVTQVLGDFKAEAA